jgi:hypothetical protein
MTCWDFCGFDQRLGSEACFSISVRRWRRLPESKILPKLADFVFQRRVFFFELFDHVDVLLKIVPQVALRLLPVQFLIVIPRS